MADSSKKGGLQQEFEKMLTNNFEVEKKFTTPEVRTKINSLDIDEETKSSWLNGLKTYLTRATQSEIIRSFGQRRGYELINSGIDISKDLKNDNKKSKNCKTIKTQEHQNAQWESFFHLIASNMLCKKFNARVISLPKKQDNVKWGNPDMIMIRDSMFFNANNRLDNLEKVDSRPVWTLSSIELKFGLNGKRNSWLDALMEASINGSWANENWLVYMDRHDELQNINEYDIDIDAIDFARRNGIGIVNIKLVKTDNAYGFSSHIVCEATYRAYLDLNNKFLADDTGKAERDRLYSEISTALKNYEDKENYLNIMNNDHYRFYHFLSDLRSNISKQPGFYQDKTVDIECQSIRKGLNSLSNDNEKLIEVLCEAVYYSLPDEILPEDMCENYEDKLADNLSELDTAQNKMKSNLNFVKILKDFFQNKQ